MIIKRLTAENFRNIESCDIEFGRGVNLLHGKNAQGKTNAVEAIYLFSRGRSFRAREDKDLVRFGTEGFRLRIEYEDKDGDGSLEYALFGRERRRRKNGYKVSKVTEMLGSFKAVLFYPDDLGLVKDGPEERRGFMNVAAAQCFPAYMKHYSDYKLALENRNAILKLAAKGIYFDEREFISWSESMAEYASYIYMARAEYVKRLEVHAKGVLADISSGEEELSLSYKSDIADGTKLTDRLAVRDEYVRIFTENSEKERLAGVSLYGVHRDDLEIFINGKSARLFASQGQQRSIVLALKLAEGEVTREMCGEYPVFLFDDVLSELDETRRKYVLDGVGERQIIITSCEPDECYGYTECEINVEKGSFQKKGTA